MKILKVFLLTFVTAFTMSNINAQLPYATSDSCPGVPEFQMDVSSSFESEGNICFDVTITTTSAVPVNLFIQTYEECIVESNREQPSFTATVCFGPDSCAPLNTVGGHVYIACGINDSNGNELCLEGCIVDIEN